MMPDIKADTWEGAAGCARDSQICNGTKPALMAKPKNASKKTRLLSGPGGKLPKLAKSREPLDALKRRKEPKRQAVPIWVISR